MTAPGTMPTAMNSEVVGAQAGAGARGSPAQRGTTATTTRERDRLPAHDEVAPRWTRGSKSNAMTAIGTVAAVYPSARSVGWPTPPLSPTRSLRRCRARHHHRHPADVRGGARGAIGGKIERVWGPRRYESRRPAHGGTGRTSRRSEGMPCRHVRRTGTGLDITLLGRFTIRTAEGARSGSSAATPRRCSPCSRSTRRPRTREAIATDLWPDRSSPPPDRSARRCTSCGRRSSRPGSISTRSSRSDAETLGLRPDVDPQPRYRDRSRRAPAIARCTPKTAVALYAGDLAEGLGHDCFAAERERLADRYEDALAIVATQRLADGDVDGRTARRRAPDRARPAARGGP